MSARPMIARRAVVRDPTDGAFPRGHTGRGSARAAPSRGVPSMAPRRRGTTEHGEAAMGPSTATMDGQLARDPAEAGGMVPGRAAVVGAHPILAVSIGTADLRPVGPRAVVPAPTRASWPAPGQGVGRCVAPAAAVTGRATGGVTAGVAVAAIPVGTLTYPAMREAGGVAGTRTVPVTSAGVPRVAEASGVRGGVTTCR